MTFPKLVVITGPTASGKTAISIKLAKKFNGEIVSADSRQIYEDMDIGTAKPEKTQSKAVTHHLIDIKTPRQKYSLGQYKKDAVKAINKIIKAGKTPFLVGGTALYISAIVNNLDIPQVKPNRVLRRKLERQMEKHGLYYLYGKLTSLDPDAIGIVDPKNPRRVIRALEITMTTKKPYSLQRKKGEPLYDILLLGVGLPENKLKYNVSKRVDQMFQKGLVNEVGYLVKKYGKRQAPFDAIGYSEIIAYLDGDISLEEARRQIKTNSWRFAKRQMTWFRKMPITWIANQTEGAKKINTFLKK